MEPPFDQLGILVALEDGGWATEHTKVTHNLDPEQGGQRKREWLGGAIPRLLELVSIGLHPPHRRDQPKNTRVVGFIHKPFLGCLKLEERNEA